MAKIIEYRTAGQASSSNADIVIMDTRRPFWQQHKSPHSRSLSKEANPKLTSQRDVYDALMVVVATTQLTKLSLQAKGADPTPKW